MQSRDDRFQADEELVALEGRLKGKVVYVADPQGDYLARVALIQRGSEGLFCHLEWKGKDGQQRRAMASANNVRTLDDVMTAMRAAASDVVSRENVERVIADLKGQVEKLGPVATRAKFGAKVALGMIAERLNRRKKDSE